ncbi:elongation factor P--(R)-beta-lysine ligase [Legionella londiniensis]|uniref:Lysyl-tRNA synthetase n=1 Tax=Legionella londiniensis TaxID=45068 RepID=A0A0W0VKW1_9GAMM|nr:elongation factor P--(R)-beta-lysine ligase [Legionella londiniensis]KTD20691.1 lysyl-tRNA synthetase [Legionella londiniensis]STX92836.1 lysyl-tRNA synthetase [Legionella londiniensis]
MNENWQPTATIESLRQRTHLLARVRNFFNERGYLEVETPILAKHGVTDVYLQNIEARFRGQTYYLQTSPEYHMKRLLAAGSGPIFQLAKVFRDDELGRWHNPEFTMLEWYQLNVTHHDLMDEVEALLQGILNCSVMKRITYQQIFLDICGFDPLQASLKYLRQTVGRFGLEDVLPQSETDKDQYLFLLLSHVIEPELAKELNPVAIYHFPPTQAALAQINHGVAERFEVYYRGIELANGFHELTDAAAQKKRFLEDIGMRKEKGLPAQIAPDSYLLQALSHGLPPCSGVALGLDRLLALAMGFSEIAESMAFAFSRA